MLEFVREYPDDPDQRMWIACDGHRRYVVTIDDIDSCPAFVAHWGNLGSPTMRIKDDFRTLHRAQLALSAIAKSRSH